MITHFMEEALLADRIVVMNEGKIYMQGGKEIFRREEELKSIGLTVPLAVRVAHSLQKAGVPLSDNIITDNDLIEELCR